MTALSSTESEWHAAADAVSEGLFTKDVLNFVGVPCLMNVHLDNSAAVCLVHRVGVGRIRHMDSRTFWLQSVEERGLARFSKIDGKDNVADIGTKDLQRPRVQQLLGMMGYRGFPGTQVVREVGSISALSDELPKLIWLATFLQQICMANSEPATVTVTGLQQDNGWFATAITLLLGMFIGACVTFIVAGAWFLQPPRRPASDSEPEEQDQDKW